jgi:RND family efflux transporter MFP subunit
MKWIAFSLLFASLTLLFGCSRPQPTVAPTKEAEVVVEYPTVQDDVVDYEDFTGRTAASKIVDIRARVTGYLSAVRFKDGDWVNEGDPLFDIDPGTYVPELERAKAAVEQATARVNRLERDNVRAVDLRSRNAISAEDADRIAGELAEAKAALKVTMKQRDQAQKFVDYLHIASPISGRISRRNIDPGNTVKADDTLLTTIYSTDPIYVNFDIDDRTELRVKRLMAGGSMKSEGLIQRKVKIGLPDKEGFNLEATVTFEEPQFNSSTGTKRFRAELPNPPGSLLSPGLFVRVRVPIGEPKRSILIPEEAIATDQTQKYVYVVNAENKVVYKPILPGLQWGRARVIDSSVKGTVTETDRVIVSGLQRVRPGVTVRPRMSEAKPSAPTPPATPATKP